MPKLSNFLINNEWSIVSNALLKSMKTPTVCKPLSLKKQFMACGTFVRQVFKQFTLKRKSCRVYKTITFHLKLREKQRLLQKQNRSVNIHVGTIYFRAHP